MAEEAEPISVTAAGAANRLGISVGTIWSLIQTKRLQASRIPGAKGRVLIRLAE